MVVKIGSRASKLALIQAEIVKRKLRDTLGLDSTIIPIKTTGDLIQDKNLYEIGGKGLFLKEIEHALLNKHVDIAVHSLKDVPASLPRGLMISAVLEREQRNINDVLISNIASKIIDLPYGATVGTSSVRRRVQLLMLRPDLQIIHCRGNVDTRCQKVNNLEVDAIVLAVAGINRLNDYSDNNYTHFCHNIPLNEMLPALGQGVIALEVCKDNHTMLNLCRKINHPLTWQLMQVERGYLETLDADCKVPIGGIVSYSRDNCFNAKLMLGDYDMRYFLSVDISGNLNNGYSIGAEVAHSFLRKLSSL